MVRAILARRLCAPSPSPFWNPPAASIGGLCVCACALILGLGVGAFLIVTCVAHPSNLGVMIAVGTEGLCVNPFSSPVFNLLKWNSVLNSCYKKNLL
jgi:hypothetical protein